MAFGDKIAAHPDKQEIIDRLLAGESVKGVAGWLKTKYANNRNRWISYLTIQRYRQDHLNLKGAVLQEIKQTANELTTERVHEQRDNAIRAMPEYEAAKTQIAKGILDHGSLILDIHDKIWDRLNKMESLDTNYKNDAVIVEYIGQLRQLAADYHKMTMDVQKFQSKNDTTTNVQVVVQQAQDQVNSLKKIVIETLQEMDPALIPVFLEKIRTRMSEVTTNSAGSTTVNVRVSS